MEMMDQFDEKIIPDLLFAVITVALTRAAGISQQDGRCETSQRSAKGLRIPVGL
jgi:hypothetical protein